MPEKFRRANRPPLRDPMRASAGHPSRRPAAPEPAAVGTDETEEAAKQPVERDRPRRRMRDDYDEDDEQYWRRRDREAALSRVKPPAICLIITASLGLLFDLVQIVFALAVPAPRDDPNMPPFLQGIQQGSHGPVAAALGGVFAIVSLIILIGAILMLGGKAHGFGIAASILAMLNFVNCASPSMTPAVAAQRQLGSRRYRQRLR